jgi:hypothetical protein
MAPRFGRLKLMIPDYTAPALPLSRRAFRRAVQVGHGRARMHVDAFGAAEFRDEILEAATVCSVYDPQVEDLPAAWLADLCVSAGVVEEFVKQAPAGTYSDRELRCALLKELATRGYSGAREALYEACQPTEYGELHGAEELIDLDGAAGLLAVARTLGAVALADPSFQICDTATWVFDEEHGEGRAVEVLQAAAELDPSIRRFLESLSEPTETPSLTREVTTVDEAVASIVNSSGSVYGELSHWGRHASIREIEPIVQIALSDAAPIVLENALRCLGGSSILPLRTELFRLLGHDDARVRFFCARTVGRHRDPAVRAAGLAALADGVALALVLLRKNTLPEDAPALRAALYPSDDRQLQHRLVFDIVDLLEDGTGVRDLALALYVYEESPCQNCRAAAVRLMLAWEMCPAWVLQEGCHDASEEVRGLCSRTGADTT